MADDATRAIDGVFDLIDGFADKADRLFNRAKYTGEKYKEQKTKAPEVIDVTPNEPKADKSAAASSSSKAVVKKANYRIVEAVKNGETVFVVTDGGSARTECQDRAFAEQLLTMLKAAQK